MYFSMPFMEHTPRLQKLSQYFNYGQSTESKVYKIVSDSDENASSIATAGWFATINHDDISIEKYDREKQGQRQCIYTNDTFIFWCYFNKYFILCFHR